MCRAEPMVVLQENFRFHNHWQRIVLLKGAGGTYLAFECSLIVGKSSKGTATSFT